MTAPNQGRGPSLADLSASRPAWLTEEIVRAAYRHFQHEAEFPCSPSAMGEAISCALIEAPTPPQPPLGEAEVRRIVRERHAKLEEERGRPLCAADIRAGKLDNRLHIADDFDLALAVAEHFRSAALPTASTGGGGGGTDGFVLVPRELIGAACSAIDKKRDAPKTLAELRRYASGDLSAPPPAAETDGWRAVLREARQWVEANTAQVRGLSAEAAAPGEAMLAKIDALLATSPEDR